MGYRTDKIIKFGIKKKLLLIIIPILICSFIISGYIAVISSRKNLIDVSSQFMNYKMEQLSNYANSQWESLQNSGFEQDDVYIEIVEKSIENYARGMIKKNTEYIFALNKDKNLEFTTANINYSEDDWTQLQLITPYNNSILSSFSISGVSYIGLKTDILNFNWNIFIVENKKSFTKAIFNMSQLQSLTFVISLILIIITIIVSMGIIIGPLHRISEAVQNIINYKDFSKKIKIEYPDEIGELAFEFNDMTSNLDLAYKKLKKFALDEAIAKKEVFIREKETLEVLGKASDYKDPETGAHIARVSSYSLILSKSFGQSDLMQDLLFNAAPLHDIGKLGIPDSILLKPGKLTPEEFKKMKNHTNIGYEILENSSSKYLKAGAVVAMSHHEKFDGTGYPKGLKGNDIPIFGRIVSIADVFDALTTKRPYKNAWPFEKAANLIREERGSHFDPEFVDLFIENITEIKIIYDSYNLL